MVMHSVFATNDVPEASTVVPLAGLAVAGFGTWFARRRSAAR
jgi:LPXTG-motif cell wall-anchored protein